MVRLQLPSFCFESRLVDGCPPQLNPGEYESTVREILNHSITIPEYFRKCELEFLELQENVFQILLGEPTERLSRLLQDSIFREQNFRFEIGEFLDYKLERLHMDDPRSLIEKQRVRDLLQHWIQELQERGNGSRLYGEPLTYFRTGNFEYYCGGIF